MNSTLQHIFKKYGTNASRRGPTEIANVGRDDLPELFRELGFKIGVEVGTAEGVFAEKLCDDMPDLKLYCVDPWEMYDDFKEITYAPVIDQFYETSKKKLSGYNCVLIRKYSMDALADFEDNSLDFVYIDGNHSLPFVINDIYGWSKKVRVGGIISGDDYVHAKRQAKNTHHVIEAVQAYVGAYRIRPWFILGLNEKIPGLKRDRFRSWMWIKQ